MFLRWWHDFVFFMDSRDKSFQRKRRGCLPRAWREALWLERLEDRTVPTKLFLNIPTNSAARDGVVQAFIDVDTLRDTGAGQQGLSGGNLVIFYDAAKLSVAPQNPATLKSPDIKLGSLIASSDIDHQDSTDTPGKILIQLSATNGYEGPPFGPGHLLEIDFHVRTDAPFGSSALVDLAFQDPATTVKTDIFDAFTFGPYTLSPAPTNANGNAANAGPEDAFITVSGTNNAPTAVNDAYNVAPRSVPAGNRPNSSLTITGPGLLANDTDPDPFDTPSTLKATKLRDPSHGSVTVNSNGSFTYTPVTGYVGFDSFTYKATDNSGMDSGIGTVNITVGTTISIPTNLTVGPGGQVLVPVNIDNPHPGGSVGLNGAALAINYDTSIFEPVVAGNITRGTVTSGWSGFAVNVDSITGQIGIALSNATPVTSTTGGSLALITFTVKSGIGETTTRIILAATNNPNLGTVTTSVDSQDGPLPLFPAPTNSATDANDGLVTVINPAPSVTINQASGQTDPTNTAPIHFTVVFSKPVTGFTTGDVTVMSTGSGTLTGIVTGSGTTYDVAVSGMTSDGVITATVAAGVAQDSSSNLNTASTSTDNTVTYDATAPTVTINQAPAQADPTNTSPIVFRVVFSESVTGFTNSDVILSDTAPGTLVAIVTGSGSIYDVSVSGMTGSGTVIASIGAGAAQDAAGNLSTASTSTDNAVTYDVTAPTVTINQAPGQADPTNTSPILFRVVFSESVTGFTDSDVILSGSAPGTLSATVTGSGTTYDVSVTGMTGNGTVIASIDAGAAQDAAGNSNTASTSTDNTVTYDATAPTVTINQAPGQVDPTNTSPILFRVVFSESVTGFTNSDVILSGTAPGTLVAIVTGSGSTYDVSVTGMTGDGTVVASIGAGVAQDGAGNLNAASTNTDNTVTYDASGPTVTLNQAPGQADPTNTATIIFRVVFSEAVADFTAQKVTLGGTAPGTLSATITGSGTTYDVSVTGMTGSGTVTASISANAVHDVVGNGNLASTGVDNTVTFTSTLAASRFAVSVPSSSSAGTPFSVTVTALDANNNTVTGYTGVVRFSSSDAQAVLPADAQLIGGVGNFTATLRTVGSHTLTATDASASNLTGSSGTVTVTAPAPSGQPDRAGVFHSDGTWTLDSQGSGPFTAPAPPAFVFGQTGDHAIAGDWNGDGFTKVGTWCPDPAVTDGSGRATLFFTLDYNGNNKLDAEPGTDQRFYFGTARPSTDGLGLIFSLEQSGNLGFGAGDTVGSFGAAQDTPIVGDWSTDGVTNIGTVRRGPVDLLFTLDMDGDGKFSTADQVFTFGQNTDQVVFGNWKPL